MAGEDKKDKEFMNKNKGEPTTGTIRLTSERQTSTYTQYRDATREGNTLSGKLIQKKKISMKEA